MRILFNVSVRLLAAALAVFGRRGAFDLEFVCVAGSEAREEVFFQHPAASVMGAETRVFRDWQLATAASFSDAAAAADLRCGLTRMGNAGMDRNHHHNYDDFFSSTFFLTKR